MSDLPALLPSDAGNLAGSDTGRQHLSHTGLNTFLNCPRKYDFQYEQRLELVSQRPSIELGRAFHVGIESSSPLLGRRALEDGRPEPQSQAEQDKLTVDAAIVGLGVQLYLDRWHGEEDFEREYEYRVRLRSPWSGHYSQTFDLLGYADALDDHGDWWELIEVKFVSQIGDTNIKRLPLDRQVALACYGVWRATGKPVRQVSYRFVRKPSIKPRQNESADEFAQRLEQDIKERPEFYAHEETLFRSDEDLVRVEAELWTWAEHMRNARRQKLWTRQTSHCHDYGGCPFIPLCVGDPDAPALYRERPRRTEEA